MRFIIYGLAAGFLTIGANAPAQDCPIDTVAGTLDEPAIWSVQAPHQPDDCQIYAVDVGGIVYSEFYCPGGGSSGNVGPYWIAPNSESGDCTWHLTIVSDEIVIADDGPSGDGDRRDFVNGGGGWAPAGAHGVAACEAQGPGNVFTLFAGDELLETTITNVIPHDPPDVRIESYKCRWEIKRHWHGPTTPPDVVHGPGYSEGRCVLPGTLTVQSSAACALPEPTWVGANYRVEARLPLAAGESASVDENARTLYEGEHGNTVYESGTVTVQRVQ